MTSPTFRPTLFEVQNARTQSLVEIVDTFVPPDSFWRLASPKHHVVLGSRGSGKTAVLKMLSHDHFSQFPHRFARRLVRERSFIGTYVPMRAEWVGTLRNKPWLNDKELERAFQWRLNISTCSAFVDTIRSCIHAYVDGDADRLIAEKKLSVALSQSWFGGKYEASTMRALRSHLEDIEWERQLYLVKSSNSENVARPTPGEEFDVELFAPLRRAITLLKRQIKFPPNAVWAVCLDELEFLDESHHRILNSHMRSASDHLYFKMATMPYFHHTLSTNTRAQLVHGDDFEYVNLDVDPAFHGSDSRSWGAWAERVLERRLSHMGIDIDSFSFTSIFGERTPLLDEKDQDWTIDSPMMSKLRRYASPETYNRARALAGTAAFRDQISRKIHGLLLLREAAERSKGNAEHELYGGPKMIARCSDGNPRQLIRIFSLLTLRGSDSNSKEPRIPIEHPTLRQQTRLMIDLSRQTLELLAFEEGIGDKLADLLQKLGDYFHYRFYSQTVTTDHFFAIRVDESIDDDTWELIKYAVGLGLLFPKGRAGSKKIDVLPGKGGVFNLAYRLAPAFGLMPRRGREVSLLSILRAPVITTRRGTQGTYQFALPTVENDGK